MTRVKYCGKEYELFTVHDILIFLEWEHKNTRFPCHTVISLDKIDDDFYMLEFCYPHYSDISKVKVHFSDMILINPSFTNFEVLCLSKYLDNVTSGKLEFVE